MGKSGVDEMKILHIVNNRPRGNGVIEVFKAVASRLVSEHSFEVDIFTDRGYEKDYDDLKDILNVGYYYSGSQVDFRKYDLVHIHSVFKVSNYKYIRKLNRHRIPYVFTLHGSLMPNAVKKSYLKKKIVMVIALRRILRKASGIHLLSRAEGILLPKAVRTYVIPNGLDVVPKNLVGLMQDFRILFLGRVDVRHKGLDLLCDMIYQYKDELEKRGIVFDIVGPYFSKNDEIYIKNKISKYCIDKLCISHGAKYGEEKERMFLSASAFIHPSRYEGMPVAVLEALSYNLPIIVTEDTNMGDIVRETESGVVVDFNVKSIYEGIIRIYENRDMFSNYSLRRKYIEDNLSWDAITRKYVKMYEKVRR